MTVTWKPEHKAFAVVDSPPVEPRPSFESAIYGSARQKHDAEYYEAVQQAIASAAILFDREEDNEKIIYELAKKETGCAYDIEVDRWQPKAGVIYEVDLEWEIEWNEPCKNKPCQETEGFIGTEHEGVDVCEDGCVQSKRVARLVEKGENLHKTNMENIKMGENSRLDLDPDNKKLFEVIKKQLDNPNKGDNPFDKVHNAAKEWAKMSTDVTISTSGFLAGAVWMHKELESKLKQYEGENPSSH